ncbi:unnamed protein product [Ceutorhynchus assimilis]|uniref:Tubulin-specific chaperone E n=1 Tax=Ceutorhynchus assimilis TaxID=467358 RepID=A0A9N9MUA1_9CUCU|nr:unnamed protein product [Ceutorhynchus assimilis]
MKNQMLANENLSPEMGVGSRIESGGFFGTVRYIGELPEHSGKWYGIEWDEPTRGKHNGTVNGVQYFETRYATSGSFVRREKINFGKNIIEAIVAKYGQEECALVKKIHEQQINNLQKTIKAPFIEFVGFDKVSTKQSDFESLEIVSVRSQNVSSVQGDLRSLLPSIRQLDLSKNLLISWQQIFEICEQLSQLYWLNVSQNVFVFPENITQVFCNVTVFICGYMNLTWQDIKKLSKIFPNINELRANNNNITYLTTEAKNCFNNLEILDLEDNPILSWDEIVKLKNIKSLQDLSIGNIGLQKIDFKTELAKLDYFFNLTKLCINNNSINDWTSVSELNKLPNLEELRFLNNPILSTEERDTSIALVIAKIGTLKVHNGRNLVGEFREGGEFRRGCEYDYLKKYGIEWLRVKNTLEQAEFLKEHNRYLELIQRYGELELGELQLEDTTKLKNSLITIKLFCQERIVTKKVCPSMQVQKLKILVQKLFKLSGEFELICEACDSFQVTLDDESKGLNYFSVKDNDTIIVKI